MTQPRERSPAPPCLAEAERTPKTRSGNMTTSKTIAALLGPTLVATALMVLFNLGAMPSMIEELSKFPMMIVLAGYAAFVPGLAIVYFHNRWTGGWSVLITVFGWLSVVHRLRTHGLPDAVSGDHADGGAGVACRAGRRWGRLPAGGWRADVQGLRVGVKAPVRTFHSV